MAQGKTKTRASGPGRKDRMVRIKDGWLEWLPFELLPRHDSTWGLCTGVDGRIYIGACGECIGGLSVFILVYDPGTGELSYLKVVAPEIGVPSDIG